MEEKKASEFYAPKIAGQNMAFLGSPCNHLWSMQSEQLFQGELGSLVVQISPNTHKKNW